MVPPDRYDPDLAVREAHAAIIRLQHHLRHVKANADIATAIAIHTCISKLEDDSRRVLRDYVRIEKFNCGGRVWSPQLLADLKAHLDGPIVLAVGSFDTAPDEDDITWYRSNEWPSSVVVMADGKSVFTFWNITTEKQ